MSTEANLEAYHRIVEDLLDSSEVQSMVQWRRHNSVNCLDHSLYVSYFAFRAARYLGLDYDAAARAGLLHDLFLYDPKDKTAHEGPQWTAHPKYALRNAKRLCPNLTKKEENIIRSHMWPLSTVMPHSKEAVLVGIADKVSAVIELIHLDRFSPIRSWLPSEEVPSMA